MKRLPNSRIHKAFVRFYQSAQFSTEFYREYISRLLSLALASALLLSCASDGFRPLRTRPPERHYRAEIDAAMEEHGHNCGTCRVYRWDHGHCHSGTITTGDADADGYCIRGGEPVWEE